MALSVFKTWLAELLTAADLNSSFNRLLTYIRENKDRVVGDDSEGTGVTAHTHDGTYGAVLAADSVDTTQIVDSAVTEAKVNGLTATFAEINTACDGVTATAAEINTVAADGKYGTKGMILGDSTAGRVIRSSVLNITGEGSSKVGIDLSCTGGAGWNGDEVSYVTDIGTSYNGTHFALSANGDVVTVKDAGITGTVQGIIGCSIINDSTALSITGAKPSISSNNILISFLSGISLVDLTSMASSKEVTVLIIYITSA